MAATLIVAGLYVLCALGCEEVGERDAGVDAGVDAPLPCAEFQEQIEGEPLQNMALTELSGLAASWRQPGVYYAHNDSGDRPRIYVFDGRGLDLGVINLLNVAHVDFEDIALGPGPDGEASIYVGDIGDNGAREGGSGRPSVQLYRFAEPSIDVMRGAEARDTQVQTIDLRYPDHPHDCEALGVDPRSGDVYLMTKEDAGPSMLFVARQPMTDSMTLEEVAVVALNANSSSPTWVTAMDFSPMGAALSVRTYRRVYLFSRALEQSWVEAFNRPPSLLAAPISEAQGESLTWARDGRSYVTCSEGQGQSLHFFTATDESCLAL